MLSNVRTCCLVSIKEDTQETRELCRTLDIEIVAEMIQKKSSPDPRTFVGAGKLEELKALTEKVDLFVFDGELKPSQHFRLETSLKEVCTDRIGLILEIFERHAKSNEAMAQVALARIRYELPFLREWVSKGISGDRPGFLAGGEYTIDAYYENARKQMKRIEGELDRISAEGGSRRSKRREQGFYLVSICGYTNGGKSTLLHALSGAETVIDDKMFSTLSTTTRLLSRSGKRVLVTDTVGFIKMLPPNLIDAFNATLEEIYESDCSILVLDLSDSVESIVEKLQTSLKILIPHIEKRKIIVALNKIDRLLIDDLQKKVNLIEENLLGYTFYLISAQNRVGIEELTKGILAKIGMTVLVHLYLPHNVEGQEVYRWIAHRFVIIDSDWNQEIKLALQVTDDEVEIIRARIANFERARMETESRNPLET